MVEVVVVINRGTVWARVERAINTRTTSDSATLHDSTLGLIIIRIKVMSVPVFKSFTLALIQLGHIGAEKAANLKHAREMILKAAAKEKKPDLIVLPVCPELAFLLLSHPP